MRDACGCGKRRVGPGGTLHHGELDQPVSLRGASALAENGSQCKRRYGEDFKRQAVEEYLSGQGSSMAIAEKYQLRSGNLVLTG